MTQSRRLGLWLVLVIVVALVVAALLWIRGVQRRGPSPLPVPLSASPLATPPSAANSHFRQTDLGATLVWVVLGGVLAIGITLIILRYCRRAAG